jgi:hypothetical protein
MYPMGSSTNKTNINAISQTGLSSNLFPFADNCFQFDTNQSLINKVSKPGFDWDVPLACSWALQPGEFNKIIDTITNIYDEQIPKIDDINSITQLHPAPERYLKSNRQYAQCRWKVAAKFQVSRFHLPQLSGGVQLHFQRLQVK